MFDRCVVAPDDRKDLGIPGFDVLGESLYNIHMYGVGGDSNDLGPEVIEQHVEVLIQPMVEDLHLMILTHSRRHVLQSQWFEEEYIFAADGYGGL
ncbi:MAG: hypothetical protein P8Y80_12275 [Acidobacteriota bacterium]